MQTSRKIVLFQWVQLLALSAVHMWVDLISNMLPSILPAVQKYFTLSLSKAGSFLAIELLICNGIQVFVGLLRTDKDKPFFMYIGMVLVVGICLIGLLPAQGNHTTLIIVTMAVVTGIGIGIVHPEGLRAIHHLSEIPPAISTAVFMAGGFVGYAGGGAVSTTLVSKFGLKGLLLLFLGPAVFIILIAFLKIRLAVEPRKQVCGFEGGSVADSLAGQEKPKMWQISFWPVLLTAVFAAISTTVLVALLPTALKEFDFELTFGGFSSTMFGLGGAIGAFIIAAIAHKKGEFRCLIFSLLAVIPFLVAYLILMNNRYAIWLLFGVGFFAVAAYILMITIARRSVGPSLGVRMGLIVGGTWATANLVYMAVLPIAEKLGTASVLKFVPIGYVCSAVLAVGLLVMTNRKVRQGYTVS